MTMMSFELTLKEDCEDTKWDKIVCSHKLVILQIQAIQMTFANLKQMMRVTHDDDTVPP
jgi:hypothetical protein